jgi:hypothetical protein
MQNPLDGPGGNPELLPDLPNREALTPELGHLVTVEDPGRPTETLPLVTSSTQARLYALADQLPLKLSHGTDEGEHETAHGGAEINLLSLADKGHAPPLELF